MLVPITTTASTPAPGAVGRDAVAAALVEAATVELAERGYAATSVRAVAKRAGVNHGLVHRHFGSKEALLGAVLDQLADAVARQLDEAGEGAALAGPALDRFLRVMARALLDGADVGAVRGGHPVVDRILPRVIERAGLPESEARALVAERMALQLGWLLFEPFVADAAGLDDVALATTRARIAAATRLP